MEGHTDMEEGRVGHPLPLGFGFHPNPPPFRFPLLNPWAKAFGLFIVVDMGNGFWVT